MLFMNLHINYVFLLFFYIFVRGKVLMFKKYMIKEALSIFNIYFIIYSQVILIVVEKDFLPNWHIKLITN